MTELQFKKPIISIQFVQENFNELETILKESDIDYNLYKNQCWIYAKMCEKNGARKTIICNLGDFIVILPFHDFRGKNVIVCPNIESLEYIFKKKNIKD